MKRLLYLVTFVLAGGALLQAISRVLLSIVFVRNMAYSHEKPGP